jgi:hypothetical protein
VASYGAMTPSVRAATAAHPPVATGTLVGLVVGMVSMVGVVVERGVAAPVVVRGLLLLGLSGSTSIEEMDVDDGE